MGYIVRFIELAKLVATMKDNVYIPDGLIESRLKEIRNR